MSQNLVRMAPALIAPHRPPVGRAPNQARYADRFHALDYVMAIGTLGVIASSPHWRVQGPAILVGYLALCLTYILYNQMSRGVLLRSKVLVAFSVVGMIHVALSWLEWLPGERSFFLREYVLRMGYFTFLLWPVTAATYALFAAMHRHQLFKPFAVLGIATCVLSAISYYLWPPVDGHWIVEGQGSGLYESLTGSLNYSISNVVVLLWWSLFYLGRNSNRFAWFAVPALLFSDSMQMNLLAALVLVIWLVRNPAQWSPLFAMTIVLGFPIAAAALVLFAEPLGIDPNTIHRAIWWVEALTEVAKNGGIALGFGADSTQDYFLDDRFAMLGKWGQLPIHVLHNDFVYTFYSMGLIGGVLFLVFHFRDLPPLRIVDRGTARHATVLLAMACLTTSSNSALVSPTLVLGLTWTYAYLLFLNRPPVIGAN